MSDDRRKLYAQALNANLNQAQNTAVLTFTAPSPIIITGFGAMADSANGLLAAGVLKLRQAPAETGTPADISNETLTFGANASRGTGYFKRASSRLEVEAGDDVIVAIETDSGGASTADLFLEYEPLPFVGSLIDNFTEKTS